MDFLYNDGGRGAAGFRGGAGDCVARAVAIASGLPYRKVYDALAAGNASQRRGKAGKSSGKRSARSGIHTTRKWFKDYMRSLGFEWVPCMGIGTGCTVHLHDGELPAGRLVVAVSKHLTAVLDGVIHDTFNPQRDGHSWRPLGPTEALKRGEWECWQGSNGDVRGAASVQRRCVYGYWKLSNSKAS